MQLAVSKRELASKRAARQLRRSGVVPAVVYGAGQEAQPVSIKQSDLEALLRGIESGSLPATVIELTGEVSGCKAVVKDIQYHRTTYQVEHIDLMTLQPGNKARIKVPVRLAGAVDCLGVKAGGAVRQVIRHVQVEALPEQLPQEFHVDVQTLEIGQSARVSAIKVPEGVRLLALPQEVVAVVAKR